MLSDDGKPKGIVTEWDILSKIVAEKKDPESVTVGELMSVPLVSIQHNAGIESVASLMTQKGVRRVMVLQGDKLLGVITAKTVLANMKNYIDRITSTISRLELTSF